MLRPSLELSTYVNQEHPIFRLNSEGPTEMISEFTQPFSGPRVDVTHENLNLFTEDNSRIYSVPPNRTYAKTSVYFENFIFLDAEGRSTTAVTVLSEAYRRSDSSGLGHRLPCLSITKVRFGTWI